MKGLETCRTNLRDNLNVNKEVLFAEIPIIGRRNLRSRKMFITSLHNQLIPLYNGYLEEESLYIRHKFHNDNSFTMNEQEKNIYFKFDLTKLKTEM